MEEILTLASGITIYREPNGAGGHSYWTDEIGGGVMVWDTCLAGEHILIACLHLEQQRRERERVENVLAEGGSHERA